MASTVRQRKVEQMRVIGLTTALCALLLAEPVSAQGWTEYVNKVDRFSVPAPGEPTTTTITWDSEYGAKFPGRVYRWEQAANRYSITVVDFSDAEKIHAAINHEAYVGGVGYWVIDIAASVAHAARLYRAKPGVVVTYDAFHYVNLITGHMLQVTNPDALVCRHLFARESPLRPGCDGCKGPAAAAHLPAVVCDARPGRQLHPLSESLLQSLS
jgi:hypothetical protein